MFTFILNYTPVVIILLLYIRNSKRHNYGKRNTLINAFLVFTWIILVLVLAISFSEFIRIHNDSGNGIDIVSYYLEDYGLYTITIPSVWLLININNQFEFKWLPLISYLSIVILFAVIYFGITDHPSCINDWDMCSFRAMREGSIVTLMLLLFFCIREIYNEKFKKIFSN